MNQGFARRFFTAGRFVAALAASSGMLAACGGAEDALIDVPAPPSYITWTGSGNGVVVKDHDNDNFAVRSDTGAIVFYTDNRMLTGLTVVGNSIMNNGVLIGSVTYTTSVTGSRITDMTCLNGLDLDITMTSSSWSYRCV